GGCTALTLGQRFPELEVVGFDINPAQLALVRAKKDAALRGDLAALNVANADPRALNQLGEFEGLFRQLRLFIEEFVAPKTAIEDFFAGQETEGPVAWTRSPYWPVAFELHFHDALLN